MKGDYSETDLSAATLAELEENVDFVEFETSNWTKNCNFNLNYLDKNQTYTVIPVTQRRGHIYFFGLGENVTFTTPDISLETEIKKITASSVKFRISRTGAKNGAISYVLLKGDYSDTDFSNSTLEELKNNIDFVEFKTSSWTRSCNFNLTYLDKNTTYTVVPVTQRKGHIYFFGLGENTVFTAK